MCGKRNGEGYGMIFLTSLMMIHLHTYLHNFRGILQAHQHHLLCNSLCIEFSLSFCTYTLAVCLWGCWCVGGGGGFGSGGEVSTRTLYIVLNIMDRSFIKAQARVVFVHGKKKTT